MDKIEIIKLQNLCFVFYLLCYCFIPVHLFHVLMKVLLTDFSPQKNVILLYSSEDLSSTTLHFIVFPLKMNEMKPAECVQP